MNNFKLISHVLRPYNLCVLKCSQTGAEAPVLDKIIFNDFLRNPDITFSRTSDGVYEGLINNSNEFGLLENDSGVATAELISVSTIYQKIAAFLNTTHTKVHILNIDMAFGLQDINTEFVIYIYKYL